MTYEPYAERIARHMGVAGVDPKWSSVAVGNEFEMQYDGLPIIRFGTWAEGQAFLIGTAVKV